MRLTMDRAGGTLRMRRETNAPEAGTDVKPVDEGLMKACKEFESVFVSMLMKGMRKTVPQSGFLSGPGEDTFREMLDDEYAKSISMSGRLGIAKSLYRELSQKNAK